MATLDLGLTASPHRKVFRELVNVLTEDATLRRVIRRWATWDGRDESMREPGDGEIPFCALSPSLAREDFDGPGGFASPLTVDVLLLVEGSDVDDVIDLWRAFRRACYPGGATNQTIRSLLVAAGAETGEPLFSSPSFAPLTDGDGTRHRLRAVGSITLNVIDDLNV